MEWKHSGALWLLALIPLLAAYAGYLRSHGPCLPLPSEPSFRLARPNLRARLAGLPFLLRLLVLIALVLAIARPRSGQRSEQVVTEGVDIIIALDVSGSMRAEDFHPYNRLGVAQDVVRRFIDSRVNDRMGLVIFAGRAYTQCPLTSDHSVLSRFIDDISFDSVDAEGTAIGMALATAVTRLRDSPSPSRIVVLVTDGMNNRGAIDPLTAAQAATAVGVKVYTIGVGTTGAVPFPTDGGYDYAEVPLDEPTLTTIAKMTDGFYFRATDAASFEQALVSIGELEKHKIVTQIQVEYVERFAPLLAAAFALLALETLLTSTWLARLP